MLMMTVWMMGIATACIGLLPSFNQIGWWAPVLLVTLRAIQGFAVGGEWGGAALLAVESAPKNKKPSTAAGSGGLRRGSAAFHRPGLADQRQHHQRAVSQLGLAPAVLVQRGAGVSRAVDPQRHG
jgi:hypothetical protein